MPVIADLIRNPWFQMPGCRVVARHDNRSFTLKVNADGHGWLRLFSPEQCSSALQM